MGSSEVPDAPADRQTGPVPQGPSLDEASPDGGPASSGPPPTGHPSASSEPHPAPGEGSAEGESAPADTGDAGVDSSAPEMSADAAEAAAAADKDLPNSPSALKVLVKRYETERNEYLQQMQRVKADFENYRKRMLRQQTEHLERAAEALVEKLLPVLDNFDAAVSHATGFEQVHASLMSTLEKEGLERIHPEGKPFDPSEADAVAHEDGDGGPVVAEVLRSGYRWKGRVVRPAMVRVRG
jgi:molecular chaperone GrpE